MYDPIKGVGDLQEWRDIAVGLVTRQRYAGALYPGRYDVLRHSLLCAQIAAGRGGGRTLCRAALLHDIAEAFLGDVPGPIKGSCWWKVNGVLMPMDRAEEIVRDLILIRLTKHAGKAQELLREFTFARDRISEIDRAALAVEVLILQPPAAARMFGITDDELCLVEEYGGYLIDLQTNTDEEVVAKFLRHVERKD